MKFNKLFLSKVYCLVYAGDVIKQYGGWVWRYGYSYKKMSATRIATELYAHAVLYAVGVGLLADSVKNAFLDTMISKLGKRGSSDTLRTIRQKINYLELKAGCYLFDRCRIINVNNNETRKRMVVFNIIWALGIV